jgi:hypothetical protein
VALKWISMSSQWLAHRGSAPRWVSAFDAGKRLIEYHAPPEGIAGAVPLNTATSADHFFNGSAA